MEIGKEAFEPLFHKSSLGPIPEYLKHHTSVHGCIAKYEQKLEELERWKVYTLNLWLQDKVEKKWCTAETVYELCRGKREPRAPEKYWFKLSEDKSQTCPAKSVAEQYFKLRGQQSRGAPTVLFSMERGKLVTQAKPGDRVRVHYTGTLEDGTVFSSTYEEDEPFEFTIGEEGVLPSFKNAVVGMKEGDTKTILVSPEDGYGQHREELVYVLERAQAPAELELELGKRLQIRLREGKMMIATIRRITEDSITLDANDPLAGRTLKFEIELVKIL